MPLVGIVRSPAFERPVRARSATVATHRALPTRLTDAARLVGQLAVLWAIGASANAAVAATHVPVPGNAVAMFATFALLASGVLRPSAVDRAAALLVKHLTVFFVPYAVGNVALWNAIAPHALRSFGVLLASVACGIVATGATAQWLMRWRA